MTSREELAETIHKARWPADRQMAITPFADEDRNGREYCFRIADAVLGSAFAQRVPSAEQRLDEDMNLLNNTRKETIETCAKIADEGFGGAAIAEAIRNLDRDYALASTDGAS